MQLVRRDRYKGALRYYFVETMNRFSRNNSMSFKSLNKIELLAPARDVETACIAIDYGADAVYMGAPRFGARQAAGNSVEDIAAVADYAHLFGVRVYVALNTVVFEHELKSAESVAREVIAAGVDALIVQDMAYMEMGLSGVEMHASTQTFNATPEKVKFLAGCGFSRVILERNLSMREIEAIRRATDVELECFVHGAICVCYSGRCYMSRTMSTRSGNRGDCSQACRLAYDLLGADGKVIQKEKHLLSVKDMNLSGRVGELIDAGITSFKIEGRLKDAAYVKNVVSWYRQRLDEEIALRAGVVRASAGRSFVDFVPDLSKTFSRRYTEYFYGGVGAGVSTPDTPKAVGESMNRVVRVGDGWIECDGCHTFTPGDGVCALIEGELCGTNINRVEGARIYPNREFPVRIGSELYRNYDKRFNDLLDNSRTRRLIDVSVSVVATNERVEATFTDEEGFVASATAECLNGIAKDSAKMADAIRTQLARSGDTLFRVIDVVLNGGDTADVAALPFVRMSELNALRREGLERLLEQRKSRTPERKEGVIDPACRYPYGTPDSSENINNSAARRFYARFGAAAAADGYDLSEELRGVAVMQTPFCVRRENGLCLKRGGNAEPLRLRHGQHIYRLEFDCGKCQMRVVYEGRQE